MPTKLLLIALCALACAEEPPEQTADPAYTQFTTSDGYHHDADWSPDGQWIAFSNSVDEFGTGDIWIQPVQGGPAQQVTTHAGVDRAPAWSPDSKRLLYTSDRSGDFNIWTIDPFKGEESARQVTTEGHLVHRYLSDWSPDGKEIVFASTRGHSSAARSDIWIIPSAGGTARQFTGDPDASAWDPAWSPDGQYIAYNKGIFASRHVDLWIAPVAGGPARQLTDHPGPEWNPTFSPDGRWIAYTGFIENRLGIWIVATAGGTPRLLPPPAADADQVAPKWSPDGQRLSMHITPPRSREMRIMPAAGGSSRLLAKRRWSGGDWSPDGQWIVYNDLNDDGDEAIWKVPAAGGSPVRLTKPVPFYVGNPRWTPDGKKLLYSAEVDGQIDLWTMPADGGVSEMDASRSDAVQPTQLTITPGRDFGGTFSPDGRHIAFTTMIGGNRNIVRMPATGGLVETLIDWPSQEGNAHYSPDGQYIVFNSTRPQTGEMLTQVAGTWSMWIVPSQGGVSQMDASRSDAVPATWLAEGEYPHWSPDGRSILFVKEGDLWTISPAGGPPERLMQTPEAETMPRYSPDGSQILYSSGRAVGDIWIADLSGTGLLD